MRCLLSRACAKSHVRSISGTNNNFYLSTTRCDFFYGTWLSNFYSGNERNYLIFFRNCYPMFFVREQFNKFLLSSYNILYHLVFFLNNDMVLIAVMLLAYRRNRIAIFSVFAIIFFVFCVFFCFLVLVFQYFFAYLHPETFESFKTQLVSFVNVFTCFCAGAT